ncbi:MAG: alpha-L-fucosidase [Planctomycetota bacterium]|nr:alpha-L-fucosidase [Planctomycetota bacterium]
MATDREREARAGKEPKPYGATPSERQLRWHGLEFYGFLHFTVNTFTNKEWGFGDETPATFAPTAFDAAQIVDAAARGGMAGLILTCKHHDGFCLWPSRFTEHSVKNSPWKRGKGDVVRDISRACEARGLKFGVYLSPWDRNHAEYGRAAYVNYYREQLRELLSEYGPIFEVWFDGANGGDGFYGGSGGRREIDRHTYYDWEHTWQIVRGLQPLACMFSDAGPDVRWVGNEDGVAGDPCWHTIGAQFVPGEADCKVLNEGQRGGAQWLPAECDVSIRPGWFYHAAEDDKVRSPENLLDLYYRSVGRGGSFLLNLPPDTRGRIHENDARSLLGFRARLTEIFATDLARGGRATSGAVRGTDPLFGPGNLVDGKADTYWASDDGVTTAEAVVEFPAPVTFNVARLREYLPLGQRVERWALDVEADGAWREYAQGTAIGNQRLARGATCTTKRVRLRVGPAPVCPAMSELALFYDPRS